MYLQPNISIVETIDIIKEKIKTKTPFCLTRYGDGEIGALMEHYSSQDERFFCNLYNYKHPTEVKQLYIDAKPMLMRALKSSDIIGIMDKNCEIVSRNLYNDRTWSLPDTFMVKNGIDVEKLTICDHMLSRNKLVGDINEFKKILDGNDLHIISSNKKGLSGKNLSSILEADVNITNYPPEINLNNRGEFIKNLKNIDGTVVLLGTGFNKDYGIILRDEYGKICLDFGATLDAWADVISRPWFNHGNKQDYLRIK